MRSHNISALGISLVVHVILLGSLAMIKFNLLEETDVAVETIFSEERQQEEFSQDLTVNTEVSESLSFNAGGAVSATNSGSNAPPVSQQKIEESESLKDPDIPINVGNVTLPGLQTLGQDLGETEIAGETGAIVEGYGAAMSRLTQEIIRMMRQQKVMVVWLFDESDSMKDDREDIREQFAKVYEELGIAQEDDKKFKSVRDETLLTAVLSFGNTIHTHTAQPTKNIPEIQAAINKIPIDESGDEKMFAAVNWALDKYTPVAQKQRRKLAIVIVSDESGDDGQNIEEVITRVKRTKSPVYIMGREAMFGTPWGRMKWVDPEDGWTHWVRIRRGPETAFPEALQWNGLHDRHDSYSSGFGPYTQARLAKESGGILFLLASDESELVGRGAHLQRKFEHLAMKEYEPLLLSARDYAKDRAKSRFRSILWDVINDLDPGQDRMLQMRGWWYPFEAEEFQTTGAEQFRKALGSFKKTDLAIQKLESIRDLRATEDSMRWRAAYDLALAQVYTFRVRLFQFMLTLDSHAKNRPTIKNPKSNVWVLRGQKTMREPDEQQKKATQVDLAKLEEQKKKAIELLNQVKKNHPGTPWELVAQQELNSHFGYRFDEGVWDPRWFDRSNRPAPPKF